MILMTLAALGSVPKAELEAAEIDQIPWLKRSGTSSCPMANSSSCSASSAHDRRLQDDGLGALMTNGGPGDIMEFVGLGVSDRFSRRSRSGTLSVSDHHAARRDCLCLIYLYVLNYRETRAQLKYKSLAAACSNTYFCGWWRFVFFSRSSIFWRRSSRAARSSAGSRFSSSSRRGQHHSRTPRPQLLEYLKMSFILSIGSVLIALVVSFLAAYSFSRYRPTGTNLSCSLLSTRMVRRQPSSYRFPHVHGARLVQDVPRDDLLAPCSASCFRSGF